MTRQNCIKRNSTLPLTSHSIQVYIMKAGSQVLNQHLSAAVRGKHIDLT